MGQFRLSNIPQKSFNLGHQLLASEVCPADGCAGTSCYAGAASLAQGGYHFGYFLILIVNDGLKWAKVVANAAARALFSIN
jgi:hypothetical protein